MKLSVTERPDGLPLAAMEIDKKERTSGKVKLNSYKGFFEKLANDLLED